MLVMKKFVLKKVEPENFKDLLYLIKKLAKYEKLEGPNKNATARLKKDLGKRYFAYLGYLNNQVIAYTIFFFNYSSFVAQPILYIEDIFILKKYRTQGIGRQILNFILQQAKKYSCCRVEWCVLNWNKPAIKFYERIKAQKLAWTFYRINL